MKDWKKSKFIVKDGDEIYFADKLGAWYRINEWVEELISRVIEQVEKEAKIEAKRFIEQEIEKAIKENRESVIAEIGISEN
jgi:hypothetical protein